MDTNSYINLSDIHQIFENLDENIKEFYNNFLKFIIMIHVILIQKIFILEIGNY